MNANLQPCGSIDVSRFPERHLPALREALAYLQHAPTLWRVFGRIRAARQSIFIEFHPAHTKFLHHNPVNLRIQWNPFLGLRDITGWLTPALLLGHELGHAQFTSAQRCAMLAQDRPRGFQNERFGVEEALVMSTVERPAACRAQCGPRPRSSVAAGERRAGSTRVGTHG